jgi:AcrR family transcriptional regulator
VALPGAASVVDMRGTESAPRRRDPAATRAAIIEASLECAAESGRVPTAREISERAGVAERTIFVHFSDLEQLREAAALRQRERWLALASPVDASWPVERRVEALVEQRARMYELMSPVRRVGLLEEHSSPALAEVMAEGDRWFLDDVAAAFAPEVAAEPEAGLLDALDVAVSWASWDHLRSRRGLSVPETTSVLTRTLLALLHS